MPFRISLQPLVHLAEWMVRIFNIRTKARQCGIEIEAFECAQILHVNLQGRIFASDDILLIEHVFSSSRRIIFLTQASFYFLPLARRQTAMLHQSVRVLSAAYR